MHKVIKILITTSIFCNIGFALLQPIFAIYVQQIGGHILEASVAIGLFSIILGITTYIFGKIEDKENIKNKLIVLGYSIITISFFGYYFVRNPIDLFIVQIVIGFGTALLTPAWFSLFGQFTGKKREASEWGLWDGSVHIAIGIFSILGGLIAFNFGFKTLILLMFLFELLATISVSRLLWVK